MFFKSSRISCEELSQHSSNRLVILDCSIDKVGKSLENEPMYLLPNSQFFDLEKRFSDNDSDLPHTFVTPTVFTEEAQALGINNNSIIVCYDRWGIYSSPRVWWMFKAMGHKEVYVLDGGSPAWNAQEFETVNDYVKNQKGNFVARLSPEYIATKEDILEVINDEKTTIIDARSAARFNAEVDEPRAGLRKGHIPYSKNLPFDQLYRDNELKENNELVHFFEELTTSNNQQIYSCGSGVTASILAFSAEISGFPHYKVYDGSWSEWGKDENLPIH